MNYLVKNQSMLKGYDLVVKILKKVKHTTIISQMYDLPLWANRFLISVKFVQKAIYTKILKDL